MAVDRVQVKRVYEPAEPEDGDRVLVDRLWPRGLKKEDARIDVWLRDLAPSDSLRRWYGHQLERWAEFERRYRGELSSPVAKALLQQLIGRVRARRLTLLCAAKDPAHSNAEVLRRVLLESLDDG